MLSAAIVGLGQAGSRFDEEPRPCVWSHAGAYLALPETYRLLGGADPNSENRERFFRRGPDLEVFADAATMMERLKPDVVSLCTPPTGRDALLASMLAAHTPRCVVIEKPVARTPDARTQILDLCKRHGVSALVHYNRRYADVYRDLRGKIADGYVGRPVSITISAPNRLWSVQSHAVDLLLFLAGEKPALTSAMALPALTEDGEGACDLLARFPSGIAGRVLVTGFKSALVFEVDVLGAEGRLTITDFGRTVTARRFEPSQEYTGYRELAAPQSIGADIEPNSTFLRCIADAAALAHGGDPTVASLIDALASEALLTEMEGAG